MSSPMDRQASANATALIDLELELLDDTAEPRPLPLSLLDAITNGFSEDRVIGAGGFAVVYKGILGNGTAVAVKRMSNRIYDMDDKKFSREVECLMKVKHKNIVRFLGYCADTQKIFESYNGQSVMADTRQKLLCFEYLPKRTLHDYITGGSCKLEWRKCYQIIKGICQGLDYLHENNIVHLDLKPQNVLMDDDMVPKIGDFGISRIFEEKQTSQSITSNIGTQGYIAPELHNGKKITTQSDLYSLGIIIIEILTGQKGYFDVQDVLDSWREILVEDTEFEQVRICTEIGLQCVDFNPAKRPANVQLIIKKLEETEPAYEASGFDVHPRVLYFPSAPKTLIPSSLYLTNNAEEHVAFRLMESVKIQAKRCFKSSLPLYAIVEPRSTYCLIVHMDDKPKEKFIDLIVESSTLGSAHIPEIVSKSMLRGLFEKAKNVGNMVREVTLKVVSTAQQDITSEKTTPGMKILHVQKTEEDVVTCFDVNPTEEWVMTGHKTGYVRIWNYMKERKLHSFNVSYETVKSVKFIERKKWFVAASDDDFIHVYSCETKMHKITSFRGGPIVAVHPFKPYVLSASYRRGIVDIWDWHKDWECTQIFEIDGCRPILKIAFNPEDTNTFAIALKGHAVVEVRTVDSTTSNYTLCGHIDQVNCLDFFSRDDQQYLITGSDDCSAKIWDMQKYMCIYTLQASLSPVMSVLFHPIRQNLITGSKDGTVYLWSSINFRLERIINTGACSGDLWGLAYFMSSKGVSIGKGSKIVMMDMDNLKYKEESRHTSELQFVAAMKPGDTANQIPGGTELLDVHPHEVYLYSQKDLNVPQMVHLTNKTDESIVFRLDGDKGAFGGEQGAIIPSRCTYTLVLMANNGQSYRGKKNFHLRLQSIISADMCIVPIKDTSQCNELFEELIATGNKFQEMVVTVIVPGLQGQVKNKSDVDHIISRSHRRILDAHPTEPWVLEKDSYIVGKGVYIQDVFTKELLMGLRNVSEYSCGTWINDVVAECGKFIGRMERVVVGTSDGFIHVVDSCETKEKRKVTSIKGSTSSVTSMAVHPTQPYVLSASKKSEMKLWNWDIKGFEWECTQTFEDEHSDDICQLIFNPKDTKSFVSASRDHAIKVWSLESPKSKYTLFGHSSAVNCLEFFTRGGAQYLVSGSKDATVMIWDLQKRACVHRTDLMSPVVSVISLPDHPYLLIGLQDGTTHLWSSVHLRSERIFNFGSYGYYGAARVHLLGSRRVVIMLDRSVSWMGRIDAFAMDIDHLIKPVATEGNK